MGSSTTASATLTGPLADRLAEESRRRGVTPTELLGEAVAAFLDDEPTDEAAMGVGAHLPPEVLYEPFTDDDAAALCGVLTHPPEATPALRKLLRGL